MRFKFVKMFCLGMVVLAVSGCSTVGVAFTKPQRARIARLVVDEIYHGGGALAVGNMIDSMVDDGKISSEQGELLKEAAQMNYDMLVKSLDQTANGEDVLENDKE